MRRAALAAVILAVIALGILLTLLPLLAPRGLLPLQPYVAVLRLRGTVGYGSPSLLGGAVVSPDWVREVVEQLIEDPAVRAVVVEINSPGGSAAASEEIYSILRRLAERKVVVAYCDEVMASGGYYIALAADRIVVSPMCITGSIGSVMTIVSVEGLLKMLGVNVYVIKHGVYKDVGSAFRRPTEEELRILGDIVNRTAQLFIDRVRERRPGVDPEVFTARVYVGEEAVAKGLADSVGTLDDAIALARKLAGLPPTAPVKIVERRVGLLQLLLGTATGVYAVDTAYPMPGVRLLYLWLPG